LKEIINPAKKFLIYFGIILLIPLASKMGNWAYEKDNHEAVDKLVDVRDGDNFNG
jgi:hypothetical protein